MEVGHREPCPPVLGGTSWEGPYLPGDAILRESLTEGVEGSTVLLSLLWVLQVSASRSTLSPSACAHLQEVQQLLGRAVQGQDLGGSRGLVTALVMGMAWVGAGQRSHLGGEEVLELLAQLSVAGEVHGVAVFQPGLQDA